MRKLIQIFNEEYNLEITMRELLMLLFLLTFFLFSRAQSLNLFMSIITV